MLKIIGNDVMQDGNKAGWIETSRIFSVDGKKIGYVTGSRIYDADGDKVGYIDGEYFYPQKGDDTRISLERMGEYVLGGDYPVEVRCAVYILFRT
jgi:hypothetical protein